MRPHNASASRAIGNMTTRIALVGSPRLRVSPAGKGGRSLQVTARGAGADWRWYTRHYRFQGRQQSEPVQLECWLARRAAWGLLLVRMLLNMCEHKIKCSASLQCLFAQLGLRGGPSAQEDVPTWLRRCGKGCARACRKNSSRNTTNHNRRDASARVAIASRCSSHR